MPSSKKPRRKYGARAPALRGYLLLPEQVARYVTPLHVALELLPLGLFNRDHANHLAMVINLVAVDSAERDGNMRAVADRAADVVLTMFRRVREGRSWNVTAEERRTLIECVTRMDRYLRTWTSSRMIVASTVVDRHNEEAKARGGKFLDRVEVAA